MIEPRKNGIPTKLVGLPNHNDNKNMNTSKIEIPETKRQFAVLSDLSYSIAVPRTLRKGTRRSRYC